MNRLYEAIEYITLICAIIIFWIAFLAEMIIMFPIKVVATIIKAFEKPK